MESCCNARCGLIAGAVIGAVVAVLGGILIPVGDIIIEETVKKESVIEPGTPAYENWVSTGASVYRQIWFFDVQNPQEVVERGVSPVLVEKGPYTYTVGYLPKANITFNANHTVSFLMPLGAIFVPRMSVGSENDTITSLNLAVAGAYTLVPKLLHTILETMIRSSNSSLFQRRTVKELLWGYQDPMLKEVVGLFSPYNGTYDGYYNIHSGKDDVSKVGIIDMWKGSKSLSFWNDAYCDMINGTTASSFPPFVDRTKPLYFFSADICRSVAALYEQTMDLKGIPVYRFGLPSSTFASPAVNPANHCYCKDVKTTKNCTIAGVLDMSSCQDGNPIYMSLPHFLYGSPSLQEAMRGLRPSEEHHSTFLDVEPMTGFTLRFSKKIQVNMMYGPSKVITVLKKVKDYTIFPVVWMNESAELDDETADLLKKELVGSIQMLDIIQKTMLGCGVAVFVVCLIAYCVVRRKHNRTQIA
ncbi:platelet glycoprotein 4 isoform X1 [Dunckerocampus dactyliophorus]|uniref:platelet glycoprotein 4 isoform X1 n=1 Tax=Dunckerocampus dactyliophorus TaxID=161453 RepID=UPI002407054A|nr:platelet glycoprotein 4 isoform X1 [Dunckerocampus dactyliophorus]